MAARMKAHRHCFTDIVAGAVVGAASGDFAHRMRGPLVLGLLPGGFDVGLRELFRQPSRVTLRKEWNPG